MRDEMLPIDVVLRETPIQLSDAADMFYPPVNLAALHNWRRYGLLIAGERKKLGWFRQGKRILTTTEEVYRFIEATGMVPSPQFATA